MDAGVAAHSKDTLNIELHAAHQCRIYSSRFVFLVLLARVYSALALLKNVLQPVFLSRNDV